MTIRNLMKKDLATCRCETNLAKAAAIMWENDQKVLPVLTATGKLLGMLWDRDVCIALGTRNVRASDLTAGDVIGSGIATCEADDSIRHALQLMLDRKSRCLAVAAHDGTFEAIVSIDDIILYAHRGNGRLGQVVSSTETAAVLASINGRDRYTRVASTPAAA